MGLIYDFNNIFEFEEIQNFKRSQDENHIYRSDEGKERLIEFESMRKILVENLLVPDSYETRLKLIFNFPKFFNFFSEYPIEGFGKFSGYPTNEDQRLIFIDFLTKYIGTETIFFDNIEDFYPEFRKNKFHLPYNVLSMGLLRYESFKHIAAEIQFFAEETSFIDEKEKWKQKIYSNVFDYCENYTRAADFFYRLYKNSENFKTVVKEISINKPYLIYYTIFYRPIYEPYIQLLKDLEELKYDAELWDEITLSKVYFKKGEFSKTELSNNDIYKITPDGKLICLLSTQSKILLIENLLKTPISKKEYKTIYEILLNFESEVESFAAQSTNLEKTNFIKGYVKKLNANMTTLSSKELKSDFYINFIKFINNENSVILSQSIINELVFHLNVLLTKINTESSPSTSSISKQKEIFEGNLENSRPYDAGPKPIVEKSPDHQVSSDKVENEIKITNKSIGDEKEKERSKEIMPPQILNEDQISLILNTLEKLLIIEDGKYYLGDRKKSSVRAVLDVMIENYKIPNHSIKQLCFEVSEKIQAGIQSLPQKTKKTYDHYYQSASKYLKSL